LIKSIQESLQLKAEAGTLGIDEREYLPELKSIIQDTDLEEEVSRSLMVLSYW
jgi:hypothetical protein